MKEFQLVFVIVLLATIAAVVSGEKIRFDNYRVYKLEIHNEMHLKSLQEMTEKNSYDFWQPASLVRPPDIMIAPHQIKEFEEFLLSNQIDYSIKIENVQKLIDNEQSLIKPRVFGWTDYGTLDEIYSWLDEKIEQFSTILTPMTVGTSYQNRTIRAVKLSHKTGNPAIFLEANIHAREWITSATATWFLNELLTSTDPDVMDMAENIDWYIIPVFNVDGFVYSHEVNRLWRKTRQNHATICFGTDANRNFDWMWMTAGASDNPCNDAFAGPVAFSEPESVALAEFFDSVSDTVKIYLSFHSYGQYLLFPWGHDVTAETDTHQLQMDVANETIQAIASLHGTSYLFGTSSQVLYVTSGTTVDYFYRNYDISIGYTFEMRDHRNGAYGFVLPADQIIPNCDEMLLGLKKLVESSRAHGVLP